jgi:hypothetical protein
MMDLTISLTRGAEPMGLFDRVKAALGGRDDDADDLETAPEISVDVNVRRAQLEELHAALTTLASDMSGDGGRMANPGWRGRVEDIRFGAAECARLSRGGFDRAALLDLAAEIRPLYGSGPVPPEYAPFHAAHERVVAAAAAVRAPLPSEAGPPATT